MGIKTSGAMSAGSGGGSKYPVLLAATYPAKLVWVIDLGVHVEYYGKDAKDARDQLQLVWEMSDEFMKDEDGKEDEEKPRWQYQDFPLFDLVAEKANSTKTYLALDPIDNDTGRTEFEGDFEAVLGVGANITLSKTPDKKDPNKFWNNVTSVTPMRAKDQRKLPGLVNEPKVFTMDDPDKGVFLSLPDKMQEKIKSSLNFGGSKLDKLLSGEVVGDDKAAFEPEDDEDELDF